ncbi:MAG: DnaA family protein [Arenicella sp.]|jgi:DnaA family protein
MNKQAGQLALPLTSNDKATFENYWLGHNTELVAIIESSVTAGDPKVLYYYGPSGVGKSHLLFAAMRLAKSDVINTSYLSLSDAYVSTDMLAVIDVEHVICVDDIDAWAGEVDKERALFTLFEQIKHAGGQLIISATQPPDSAGFVIKDLVSRLSSGLIYPLLELDDEQRFEALKMRAKVRGLSISDDAVRYLQSRTSRDTGELFEVLERIDRASLVEQRRVTIPFLQDLLKRQE